MSYQIQTLIAEDYWMRNRVAAAASSENAQGDPDEWANKHRRKWASSPGWDAKWESALVSHPNEPSYLPGKDESVITDGDILATVQQMVAAESAD